MKRFFEWPDARSEGKDGLCFEIAICEPTRGHSVSGLYVCTNNQPQTQLFWQIENLFPKREEAWENRTA